MATVYSRFRSLAHRLLSKYGAELSMVRTPMTDGYDEGAPVEGTPVTYQGTGFRKQYALKDIDGTMIMKGDVRLIIDPFQLDSEADFPQPKPDIDKITFDGTVYNVVGVDPLRPAEETVIHYVQARV